MSLPPICKNPLSNSPSRRENGPTHVSGALSLAGKRVCISTRPSCADPAHELLVEIRPFIYPHYTAPDRVVQSNVGHVRAMSPSLIPARTTRR